MTAPSKSAGRALFFSLSYLYDLNISATAIAASAAAAAATSTAIDNIDGEEFDCGSNVSSVHQAVGWPRRRKTLMVLFLFARQLTFIQTEPLEVLTSPLPK